MAKKNKPTKPMTNRQTRLFLKDVRWNLSNPDMHEAAAYLAQYSVAILYRIKEVEAVGNAHYDKCLDEIAYLLDRVLPYAKALTMPVAEGAQA